SVPRFMEVSQPFHLTLTKLRLKLIKALEIRSGHEHFAAHLDQRRVPLPRESVRDALDSQGVGRDVLAGAAITPRRGADQLSVLVAEVDREPVDLQLVEEADTSAELRGDMRAPLPQL